MELADVPDQRPDRDRVLEQTAEIGVMAGAGAGSAAERARHRLREQKAAHDRGQRRVVDLAGEMLEESLELLAVAIGGRQELGRIGLCRLEPAHVLELGDERSAEARNPPAHLDRIAAIESRADPVGVAKDAGGDGAGAIAELEREIDRAVACGEPVLAGAGVATAEDLPGGQVRNRCAVEGAGGLDAPMFTAGPDGGVA